MDKRTMMENLVKTAYEKGVFNGTWLYAENGVIVSKGAFGSRDPENSLPMTENSIFYLASVSKQFTATAVMLLRRKGLLSLEDEATKFFPELPYKGVTIRHLLTHTGGLPDYFPWVDRLAKTQKIIPCNGIILSFLCESGEKAGFAPGEKYEYSNTGYCLLAQIAEKVSGLPFEDLMLKSVFEPAGMNDTRVYHRRKDNVKIDNFAYGTYLELGTGRYTLPDNSKEADYAVSVDGMSGGGSVHSNIIDMFKWYKALREETVLTKEEQYMMYAPGRLNDGGYAVDEDGDRYGFGWVPRNDPELGLIVSHSGSMPGYSTWFERFVDADRALIILRNRDADDERAYRAFFNGMRNIARDKEPGPVRTIEELADKTADSSKWYKYCGRYGHTEDDEFYIDEVFFHCGELYANVFFKDTNHKAFYKMKLYPLKEFIFGIKRFDGDIIFGDDCITRNGKIRKKL